MTITQFFIKFYDLMPPIYWKYLYKKRVRSDAGISLESFRQLYTVYNAFQTVDRVREWHRKIMYAPFYLLDPITDVLRSRSFEDIRLSYARYFNLFVYRQVLDYGNTYKNGSDVIRVISFIYNNPFTILTIYYSLTSKTNMTSYIKTKLKRDFGIDKKAVYIKKIDKNHLQVTFSKN